MQNILAGMMGDPACDQAASLDALAALLGSLRPDRRSPAAETKLRELIALLTDRPDLRAALRTVLLRLLSERHAVILFAAAGIYPETGVVAETLRRISHKILPEADDAEQLKSAIDRVVSRRDLAWMESVSTETWAALIRALRFDEADDPTGLKRLRADLLEAARVVAHRIASAGLESEMLRLDPRLENHESPFLALCEEVLSLTREIDAATTPSTNVFAESHKHVMVLIDQCRQTIERVRRRAQQQGASFHLTFRLRRLLQHLNRLEILSAIASATDGTGDRERLVATLWGELAIAECRRNDLRRFWRQNTELMALRVSENAGKSGEHYITESRAEYLGILRSAAGGGFVIAFMAANKIFLSTLGLAPLTEVLAFSLNYALGFVFIHMLHFTVATKQPAMTANAIAAAIEESQTGRERTLQPLTLLVARTLRTQLAAILGNLGLAVPTAMLFGLAIWWYTGNHFVDPDKARRLLQDIDPIGGGALLYAAVAGVCLFLAGLIAGYYDNLCAYDRIPDRLRQLVWPRRLIGERRWAGFATYIENNLGALAGNFFFGLLLGGVSGLGMLLGLPLDIRHIAFSSAFWGYALTGLDFGVEWEVAMLGGLGVLAIGLTNLLVSFYLAMWVGLKARGVEFSQRRQFVAAILRHCWHAPREFILPPASEDPPRAESREGLRGTD